MLARNRDSCFRSCTLFGGQAGQGWRFRTTREFLHRGKNGLPGQVWIRAVHFRYWGVQRYSPMKSPPTKPIW
jgi:hypothetical protein